MRFKIRKIAVVALLSVLSGGAMACEQGAERCAPNHYILTCSCFQIGNTPEHCSWQSTMMQCDASNPSEDNPQTLFQHLKTMTDAKQHLKMEAVLGTYP